MVNRKLGRTAGHRAAMFRNQLASLIDKERIITTLPKAKELRPLIERLIDIVGPRFADRPGGYTRIIKLGSRRGDAAEMAILELMGYEPTQEAAETPAADAKAPKKAKAKKEESEPEADEAEAKPKKPAKKAAPKKEKPEAEDKPKKKAAPAKKKPAK
jgi:large subunit ribosomal protein L17